MNATRRPAPRLEFEFGGLEIGLAEYAAGPTGCTVFIFPGGAATAIDVRGGGAATVGDYERSHVICFAGGSLPGLETTSGAIASLNEHRTSSPRGFATGCGAVINDYRRRDNTVYPDYALGRAAVEAAQPGCFLLGARGAGRLAQCGGLFGDECSEPSGQGAAYRQIGPTKIAAFVVVNALGVIVDREGRVVRGNRDPQTGLRRHPLEELDDRLAKSQPVPAQFGSTTLTLITTNQRLTPRALHYLGRQVHTAMGRAIYPFHTIQDGDVLYSATTNEVDNPALGSIALGMAAAELAWDAVLASGP